MLPRAAGRSYRATGCPQRAQQVLRGLAAGHSYQGIADQLCLSLDTVRTYIRHVYRKLEVNSRSGLLAKLLKQEQASAARQERPARWR
ncbi:MAG: response regulator transcription factor [Janthinobacterium lividum]